MSQCHGFIVSHMHVLFMCAHIPPYSTVITGNSVLVGALMCGYRAEHPTAEDCS